MTMLKASGAVEMLRPMMDQLVNSMEVDIRKKAPNLPHDAYFVITEELKAGAKDMTNEMLVMQMEYFSRHLTEQDVLELTRMYESSAWKKYTQVSNKYITEEFQKVMQQEVPKMAQQLGLRIKSKLEEAGYIKDKEGNI